MVTKFTLPGVLFLFTLISGFGLSRLGKPYNGIIFNIHKLIALGAVIVAGARVVRALKTAPSPALIVVLVIAAALCVLALFASGALMSADKLDYTLMLRVHQIAPVGLALAMGVVVYLLISGLPGR